ncbi:MAG: AraC family transcriptional regulator [Clostridia bacterium]|nr:AraC family transcriptional regulator [Clostridia bacterium]
MEKAKTLLRERKDLALAEVAAQCGYGDYNYFITVFSQRVGTPPSAWRKKS